MTITKAELSEALVDAHVLNKADAKEIVSALFEVLSVQLEEGKSIKISGFGNFELRDKTARPGRNPKTGKDSLISARRVVTFKPGQKLKKRLEALDKSSFSNKSLEEA